jgi:hypothetical protein
MDGAAPCVDYAKAAHLALEDGRKCQMRPQITASVVHPRISGDRRQIILDIDSRDGLVVSVAFEAGTLRQLLEGLVWLEGEAASTRALRTGRAHSNVLSFSPERRGQRKLKPLKSKNF